MRKPSHADAELLLRLYELRRDPEMRKARAWFMTEFKPRAWDEIHTGYLSHTDQDRWFRQVITYWEMVATLVNRGVLHADLLFDSTGEDVVTWERCKPWIEGARASIRPTYLYQFERLVKDHLEFRARAAAAWTAARGGASASRPAAPRPLMSSSFGQLFVVTTFGESHGPGVGVVVDGMPPGIRVEEAAIQRDLDRRRPGQSALTSQRGEADRVQVLSGIFEQVTLGTPIAMLVANTDARSRDYDALKDVFRPGHADYTYAEKYGVRDHRGGGRSSGRETVGRVAAGALAKLALATVGVTVAGGTVQVGPVRAGRRDWDSAEGNPVRCPDVEAAAAMAEVIARARDQKDSVGGVVEVVARGVPAGWGDPTMAKLDALLGAAMLSIPATKGVEIGGGFGMCGLAGSQTNDVFDGERYATNFAGGISGGISNGAEIVVRVAVRPATSIGKPQTAATKQGGTTTVAIEGRHDPCICPRVVPVAEAMMAIVLADVWLRQRALRGRER